ncbi:polysaccharide synthase-like protein [Thermochaetoides thermophila DSM 1495]|uniref:Polysaccharide synthase-like protein n=1 Tax=Chaetomium thermophilum (strain DSM 1495 / CBS 144.50 / IMI 039719) TaxID=759272 RepID=G0SHU2_CHATD|nr:polysaccharide synthase-like protein [Thermochaetoides thermophila DSM 1495]EGS17012.1 polysaccharide synthase-like protein [Thermochaetoides thermophila DSM 1495]
MPGLMDIVIPRWDLDFLWSPKFWAIFHTILWLHRYVRLLVHCVSHWCYKSVQPKWTNPKYKSSDVTVIIPTIHNRPEELRPSLESILACQPAKLILVTTYNKYEALGRVASTLRVPKCDPPIEIEVLHVDKANKRLQVCKALEDDHVRTPITVMADDDVEWPSTLMPWLLAPFEDDRIGGVGTCQRVKRIHEGDIRTRIWNWLGAAYIERRNFEISATHNIDGGTSCMSGRTGAYRTEILKSYDFLDNFKNERWGRYILNADDDNFVTRWLVAHQWKTWIQYEPECEIETTLENSYKFLYQCSRWARSNWRSNWTSLFVERHVWRQQPWCTYALHIATFTSLAFVVDPLLLFTCWWGTEGWNMRDRYILLGAEIAFMFGFTKVVKLVGLFRKNPKDIMFLPVSILFGYFHGLIKLYALFTLKETSWGSREDGDEHNTFRLQEKPPRSQAMTTPSGPDLPKAMRHARLTQIRRVVVASQKAEVDSSSPIKGKAEGLYSIENMKSMLA